MQAGIRLIAGKVLQHRLAGLLLLGAITLFFAMALPRVQLQTIFSDLLPSQHPFVQTYKQHPNFGNPLTVFLLVKRKSGDIYNEDTLQLIWDLTRDIDLAPGVDHDQVLSVATEKARYAEATPYGIDSRPLMGDAPPSSAEEVERFRLAVEKSPYAQQFRVTSRWRVS